MKLTRAAEWQYDCYYRPEKFDKKLSISGVDGLLKDTPDEFLVVMPGSRTKQDWWRDAESLLPIEHPVLGTIPYGFSLGADDFNNALHPYLPQIKPIRFILHSLSCPRGIYQAGLLLHDGFPGWRLAITGFEPPRSCTQKTIDLLEPIKDFTLTRNTDPEGDSDIVLELPSWASHPRALMQIGSEPIAGNLVPDKDIHAIQAVMVSCQLLEDAENDKLVAR
jgi:hypothetical protein